MRGRVTILKGGRASQLGMNCTWCQTFIVILFRGQKTALSRRLKCTKSTFKIYLHQQMTSFYKKCKVILEQMYTKLQNLYEMHSGLLQHVQCAVVVTAKKNSCGIDYVGLGNMNFYIFFIL
jgi:hypothetical protein